MVETRFYNYEIMYIVDDQNPEKANSLKKEFIEILTKDNGKIIKEEDFIHQFAYEINHKTKGHYFVIELKTTPKNIADFNRIFLIKQRQGEVIRKLVINLDSEKINTFKNIPKKPEKEYNREPKDRDGVTKTSSTKQESKVTEESKEKKEKEKQVSDNKKDITETK